MKERSYEERCMELNTEILRWLSPRHARLTRTFGLQETVGDLATEIFLGLFPVTGCDYGRVVEKLCSLEANVRYLIYYRRVMAIATAQRAYKRGGGCPHEGQEAVDAVADPASDPESETIARDLVGRLVANCADHLAAFRTEWNSEAERSRSRRAQARLIGFLRRSDDE